MNLIFILLGRQEMGARHRHGMAYQSYHNARMLSYAPVGLYTCISTIFFFSIIGRQDMGARRRHGMALGRPTGGLQRPEATDCALRG